MTRKKVSVSPAPDGRWQVKSSGTSRAAGIHETKAPAIQQAKKIAQAAPLGQVLVKGMDGRIQTRWSRSARPGDPTSTGSK